MSGTKRARSLNSSAKRLRTDCCWLKDTKLPLFKVQTPSKAPEEENDNAVYSDKDSHEEPFRMSRTHLSCTIGKQTVRATLSAVYTDASNEEVSFLTWSRALQQVCLRLPVVVRATLGGASVDEEPSSKIVPKVVVCTPGLVQCH